MNVPCYVFWLVLHFLLNVQDIKFKIIFASKRNLLLRNGKKRNEGFNRQHIVYIADKATQARTT